MKVIDLLNMWANGEDVNTIDEKGYFGGSRKLLDNLNSEIELEDTPKEEIQVLSRWYPPKEDNKIEKLDNKIAYCDGTYETRWNDSEMYIVDKINEIIDKVNGKDND